MPRAPRGRQLGDARGARIGAGRDLDTPLASPGIVGFSTIPRPEIVLSGTN